MSRLGKLMRTFVRRTAHPSPTPSDQQGQPGLPAQQGQSGLSAASGTVEYAPNLNGRPDPGEVVWAWVAYEEDPSQGKDRPVLVIGRDGSRLLALQLTSKDHDLDAEDEARHGRYWMDIGSGDWDHQRRPSEVRLDRLLRLEERGVRREGAVLDRDVFDAVIREVRTHHDL